MLNVALLGATGRMGKTVVRALADAGDLALSGALASTTSASINEDAGILAGAGAAQVPITDDLQTALAGADIAIDFSLADAVATNVEACQKAGCPAVICVTALSDSTQVFIDTATAVIPVVVAANTSVGVNLALRVAAVAAATLGEDYDAQIVETHHHGKVDAPSGTALELGNAVADAWGAEFSERAVYGRDEKTPARRRAQIGISSVRAGDVVGEHSLVLATPGEIFEIRHRATDRMTFAMGALRAARWIAGQPAGRYGMSDVLELG